MTQYRERNEEVIVSPGTTVTLNGRRWNGTSSDFSVYTDESFQISCNDTVMTRTMKDFVEPNFKKRIAKGEVINNPMESAEVTLVPPKHTSYSRSTIGQTNGKYWGSEHIGQHVVPEVFFKNVLDFPTDFPAKHAELQSEIALAVTKAHANANSSEISGLVTAAEAEKTVQSIGQIIWRVVKIARAAKRLDVKYLRKQISKSELTDRYMELRYALRPLVADARGIVDATVQMGAVRHSRATARAFATLTHNGSDTEVITRSADDLKYTCSRYITRTANIRAGVLCDINLSNVSIWGLDQPIEAIWELVPFSFVIDWFLNIGDTIAAWTPNAGVRELASWVTVDVTESSVVIVDNFENISSYSVRDEFSWSGSISRLTRHRSRTVNPELSLYPKVKVRLDSLKLLDLVAMGRNFLR